MYNPFSLENKTILVTGASSGIGRSTAVECAKMGANVVITGRNAERLQETLELCREKALPFLYETNQTMVVADLQNENDIAGLVEKLPELQGIVHNAGVTKKSPFKFINQKEFNRLMQTNLYAPIFITQQLFKAKKLQKSSSIVFISSIATFNVGLGDSMYAASKGAVNSFAKVMAVELAKQKIRVNYIQPGIVNTHIFDDGIISEEQLKETERKYPLGRFGDPNDIAHAVIYFLSDASSWVTGSGLVIDGGFTLL